MVKLSDPQEYVVTTTQAINAFIAGVGSGKTHVGGIISGFLISTFPWMFGFLGANTHNQLSTSTLYRIREVWLEVFGWVEGIHYVMDKNPPKWYNQDGHNFKSYNGIASFWNGAVVFLGSLENAKAHDGKQFGWALLDETKDTRESDVKEIILSRLRQLGIYINEDGQLVGEPVIQEKLLSGEYVKEKRGNSWVIIDQKSFEPINPFNPLYILTSPAKTEWLNDWFSLEDYRAEIEDLIFSETEYFKKEFADKCVVISSTYHNAENLPSNFIDRLYDNNPRDIARMLIYANPFAPTGGEFYSSYNSKVHAGTAPFDPTNPVLHITFDQNVVPYVTMLVYQIDEINGVNHLRQIDEFCLRNPNNTTEKACEMLKDKYGDFIDFIYYYGDPSGRKRDTRRNENDYQIVQRVLAKWLSTASNRVPKSAPSVVLRRDWINGVFENKFPIRVLIDSGCTETQKDFTYLKQDRNGNKKKEIAVDPHTGERAEKYGHTSDAFDYLICELFADYYNEYVNNR